MPTSSNGSATVELMTLIIKAVESVTGNSSGLAEVNISDLDAGTN